VRQQLSHLPFLAKDAFFSSAPALAAEFDCSPLAPTDVDSLIQVAAHKNSLDPGLLRAVMQEESAFRPCAISAKGAQGLMQLMPSTAERFHVTDAFDPKQNVQAGAAFLKQLLSKYKGDIKSSLIAYNAGANRADRTDLPIPAETQSYVTNIFADLGMHLVESSVIPQENSEPGEEEPEYDLPLPQLDP
jgi:soluble lytic murein transglycosylase-like protein